MPAYIQAQEPNYFGQLLAVLTTAELVDLKSRCHAFNPRLSEILEDEVIERTGIANQSAQ